MDWTASAFQILSVGSGQEDALTPLIRCPDIQDALFADGANRLFLRTGDSRILAFDLSPASQPISNLEQLALVLTGMRVDDVGGTVAVPTTEVLAAWTWINASPADAGKKARP